MISFFCLEIYLIQLSKNFNLWYLLDNPVGVDWYAVTDHGDQFGPFGALTPLQKDGQVGRGIFRCAGDYFPKMDGLNATERKLENQQLPGN